MSIMFDSSQGKGMVGSWIVDAASPVQPGLISWCQARVYINTHVPSLCISHTYPLSVSHTRTLSLYFTHVPSLCLSHTCPLSVSHTRTLSLSFTHGWVVGMYVHVCVDAAGPVQPGWCVCVCVHVHMCVCVRARVCVIYVRIYMCTCWQLYCWLIWSVLSVSAKLQF